MNKARRRRIAAAMKEIEEIQEAVDAIHSSIEDIMAEEEEYLDNMPENLAGSGRAQEAEKACDTLGDAIDSLAEVMDSLGAAISELAETGADPGTIKGGSTGDDEDDEAPAVLITVHTWKDNAAVKIKTEGFPSREEAYAAMKAALRGQVAKESKTEKEVDEYMETMEDGIEYSNMKMGKNSAAIYMGFASSMWAWQIHEVKGGKGS